MTRAERRSDMERVSGDEPGLKRAGDRPLLVLLPGMNGTVELFAPLLAVFGGRVDCLALAHPAETLDYGALAERLLSRLPTDRPYVLLGESFSGPLAVMLAAKRPTGLTGLVLCCSFLRNPRPVFARLATLGAFGPGLLPLRPLARYCLGAFARPELVEMLRRAWLAREPAVLRARLHALVAVDVRETYRALDLPVLDLRADHDRILARRRADEVAALRPATTSVVLPGPHFLLQACPEQAGDVLLAFLDGLGDRGAKSPAR